MLSVRTGGPGRAEGGCRRAEPRADITDRDAEPGDTVLNQIGDAGLRDQVNQHYVSTFGAAAAVGLITGLAQFLGTAGVGSGDGNRTVIIAGSGVDTAAQATTQVMNRFLNRLPTITIREGHRVKVYLTGDLDLPAYEPSTVQPF